MRNTDVNQFIETLLHDRFTTEVNMNVSVFALTLVVLALVGLALFSVTRFILARAKAKKAFEAAAKMASASVS